ncbi:MAG: SCO family protein [Pyrinomonadaceae bacterium]
MRQTFFSVVAIAILSATSGQAQTSLASEAQSKVTRHPAMQTGAVTEGTQSPAQKYFTDVELMNQNGEKMRLYSDLLKGRVVVINSFFATCNGSCLPMNRNMEKIQEAMGDRMGRQVYLISISVDPITDTPERLKEYADRFHAKPGRYFITGKKENVDFALNKLGQYVAIREDHLNIFIIGNEATGLWKKAFGLAKTEELLKVVESVISDKATGGQ